MSINLAPGTTEFVYATITASDNISADVVDYAVMVEDAVPLEVDWVAVVAPTRPDARTIVVSILVANAVVGNYTVWIRLADTPERPVVRAGTFTVA